MPPERLDLLDQRPGLLRQLGGQALDVVGAGQRIDDIGDRRSRAAGSAGCCGRCAPRIRSAARSPRRSELVCRHWVPPSTAASASKAVRTMLLYGSCSCSADAAGLAMGAQHQALGPASRRSSVMIRCHSSRAARSFATSMKKFMPMAKKKLSRPAKASTSMPAGDRRAHILPAVGQREAELLHQRSRRPPACGSRRSRSS